MNARLNDVLVHINETLDDEALHRLEEGIRHDAGVISVGHRPEKTHMIMVVYDTDATRASSLLHRFEERGLHAQLVGLCRPPGPAENYPRRNPRKRGRPHTTKTNPHKPLSACIPPSWPPARPSRRNGSTGWNAAP